MRIPLSWLKEFIDIETSPEEFGERLTCAGLEVEEIISPEFIFTNVVTAKVVEVKPHPEADKLVIAQVDTGDEELQVVCGAPNCRKGLITACAKVGAHIKFPDEKPLKIKAGKLRGISSMGMLCAAKELGLSENDDGGIMELPSTTPIGIPLESLYDDKILDIYLTPNLGHCNHVYGLARELSALYALPLKELSFSLKAEGAAHPIEVSSKDTKSCPQYHCRILTDVLVSPSPAWLQKRLEDCGVKSINNVVDITNLVMLEIGQPLHAFDYDTLSSDKIVVSHAKEGETITLLDHKEHTLTDDVLLVRNGKTPIALAGVMGNHDTEVSDTTKTVLLESAEFSPSSVRKTCKVLNMRTSASSQFEKGIDPSNVTFALDYAASLIETLCSATTAKDISSHESPPLPPKTLSVRLDRTNTLLGTHLSLGDIESIFSQLQFVTKRSKNDALQVTVPLYRRDITAEIDLIEEVARIYGYDNIPHTIPSAPTSNLPHDQAFFFSRRIRAHMIGLGLNEFLTCDLIDPNLAKITCEQGLGDDNLISVLRPSSVDQSVLRTTLLPSMLLSVKHNLRNGIESISAFELGKIHFKLENNYVEKETLGILLTGAKTPPHFSTESTPADFFDLKGLVENQLAALLLQEATFVPSNFHTFHPNAQAYIELNNEVIGVLGEVHPNTLSSCDISQPVFYAQLDLEALLKQANLCPQMKPLPAFPGSTRDWTITLSTDMPYSTLLDHIHKVPSRLLTNVNLLDIYQDEALQKSGKHNVTFRFFYRDLKKTLKQEAVEKEHARILKTAQQSL